MTSETKSRAGKIEVVTVERTVPVDLIDTVQVGDRVTILTPQNQELTGRATIYNRQYDSWVCAISGSRYGQPMIASRSNTIRVKKGRK